MRIYIEIERIPKSFIQIKVRFPNFSKSRPSNKIIPEIDLINI